MAGLGREFCTTPRVPDDWKKTVSCVPQGFMPVKGWQVSLPSVCAAPSLADHVCPLARADAAGTGHEDYEQLSLSERGCVEEK